MILNVIQHQILSDLFEKLIILENIIKCAEELTGRNSETP